MSNVDQSWTRLVNGLSGQLCASLNFLDSTVSVSPRFTYAPAGVLPDEQSNENVSLKSKCLVFFFLIFFIFIPSPVRIPQIVTMSPTSG